MSSTTVTYGNGGAKRRDGSEAASPDDDDGARSGRAPRNPSHPAGGMAQKPVEELPTVPLEPSAEAASVTQPDSTTSGSATVFLTEARRRPTTARALRASPHRWGTRPRESWRRHGVVATTLKLQTCTIPPSTCPCRAPRRESIPYQMGPPRPLVRRSRRKARALVYSVALTKKELRSTKKSRQPGYP